MEFFKNFCKEDKIIGLCSLKKQNNLYKNFGYEFESKFAATKLLYEPKFTSNMFYGR